MYRARRNVKSFDFVSEKLLEITWTALTAGERPGHEHGDKMFATVPRHLSSRRHSPADLLSMPLDPKEKVVLCFPKVL